MIATAHIDIVLENEKDNFEILTSDVDDYEHEIEVYSDFLNPSLKRGWVGDLIYYCHKGYVVHTSDEVQDKELVRFKNVLLRSVQCFSVSDGEPVMWKYTFLKD